MCDMAFIEATCDKHWKVKKKYKGKKYIKIVERRITKCMKKQNKKYFQPG